MADDRNKETALPLPAGYVTLAQLKMQWLKAQEEKKQKQEEEEEKRKVSLAPIEDLKNPFNKKENPTGRGENVKDKLEVKAGDGFGSEDVTAGEKKKKRRTKSQWRKNKFVKEGDEGYGTQRVSRNSSDQQKGTEEPTNVTVIDVSVMNLESERISAVKKWSVRGSGLKLDESKKNDNLPRGNGGRKKNRKSKQGSLADTLEVKEVDKGLNKEAEDEVVAVCNAMYCLNTDESLLRNEAGLNNVDVKCLNGENVVLEKRDEKLNEKVRVRSGHWILSGPRGEMNSCWEAHANLRRTETRSNRREGNSHLVWIKKLEKLSTEAAE